MSQVSTSLGMAAFKRTPRTVPVVLRETLNETPNQEMTPPKYEETETNTSTSTEVNVLNSIKPGDRIRRTKNGIQIDRRPTFMRTFTRDSRKKTLEDIKRICIGTSQETKDGLNNLLITYKNDDNFKKQLKTVFDKRV